MKAVFGAEKMKRLRLAMGGLRSAQVTFFLYFFRLQGLPVKVVLANEEYSVEGSGQFPNVRSSNLRLFTIKSISKKEVKMTINFLAVAVILLCFAGVGYLSYRRGFDEGQKEMESIQEFLAKKIKEGKVKVSSIEFDKDVKDGKDGEN